MPSKCTYGSNNRLGTNNSSIWRRSGESWSRVFGALIAASEKLATCVAESPERPPTSLHIGIAWPHASHDWRVVRLDS